MAQRKEGSGLRGARSRLWVLGLIARREEVLGSGFWLRGAMRKGSAGCAAR